MDGRQMALDFGLSHELKNVLKLQMNELHRAGACFLVSQRSR
jgi:hypothetical protein